MFASKTTRGFYDSAIHGENMPADVVKITPKEHALLIEGQSQGKLIAFDKDGRPFLSNPIPPSAEQIQAQVNAEARAYLLQTDWYVTRLQETGEVIPDNILQSRAEARSRVVDIEV